MCSQNANIYSLFNPHSGGRALEPNLNRFGVDDSRPDARVIRQFELIVTHS